mgnify:CR=1 FL=1
MRKNKKVVVSAAAVTMSVLLGACGGSTSSQATSTEAASEAETEAAESADSDQEAADKVAKLIDDIYVQERTDDTDEQCKAAKEAWDALTDEQKELVEGENADPDYFGRDTGDASLDDPRNQDEIGDKEILVVSFGTSFNDSRVKDIKSIEDSIQDAFPDWAVRRAFTAQIIINHVEARDGSGGQRKIYRRQRLLPALSVGCNEAGYKVELSGKCHYHVGRTDCRNYAVRRYRKMPGMQHFTDDRYPD